MIWTNPLNSAQNAITSANDAIDSIGRHRMKAPRAIANSPRSMSAQHTPRYIERTTLEATAASCRITRSLRGVTAGDVLVDDRFPMATAALMSSGLPRSDCGGVFRGVEAAKGSRIGVPFTAGDGT